MKQATINKLKKIGKGVLAALKWVFVHRTTVGLVLRLVGLGALASAIATGGEIACSVDSSYCAQSQEST